MPNIQTLLSTACQLHRAPRRTVILRMNRRSNHVAIRPSFGPPLQSLAAIGGAISYFGMPDLGIGNVGAEPDLKIVLNENLELNERADGTPYFIASGSIVNPTGMKQDVPELLVTLKDASGRPVYSWKMKPKVRSLAPGAKVDFSEARLDVPLAARQISVGWVLNGV